MGLNSTASMVICVICWITSARKIPFTKPSPALINNDLSFTCSFGQVSQLLPSNVVVETVKGLFLTKVERKNDSTYSSSLLVKAVIAGPVDKRLYKKENLNFDVEFLGTTSKTILSREDYRNRKFFAIKGKVTYSSCETVGIYQCKVVYINKTSHYAEKIQTSTHVLDFEDPRPFLHSHQRSNSFKECEKVNIVCTIRTFAKGELVFSVRSKFDQDLRKLKTGVNALIVKKHDSSASETAAALVGKKGVHLASEKGHSHLDSDCSQNGIIRGNITSSRGNVLGPCENITYKEYTLKMAFLMTEFVKETEIHCSFLTFVESQKKTETETKRLVIAYKTADCENVGSASQGSKGLPVFFISVIFIFCAILCAIVIIFVACIQWRIKQRLLEDLPVPETAAEGKEKFENPDGGEGANVVVSDPRLVGSMVDEDEGSRSDESDLESSIIQSNSDL